MQSFFLLLIFRNTWTLSIIKESPNCVRVSRNLLYSAMRGQLRAC